MKHTKLFASALVMMGMLGASPYAMAQTFTNATPISIEPTTPYPSPITVSGLGGGVTDVRVDLHGFSHAFTRDVDVLLVGPDGRKIMLMSDVGDAGSESGATETELTFSADAASIMGTPVVSGFWLPTNLDDTYTFDGGSDSFPAPAPAGPYSTDPSALSGDGAAFNGVWQLFVSDDFAIFSGAISGGWSLSFSRSATCASEGYKGAQLTWCKNICENGLSGKVLDTWIHRWIERYRDLPYCAVETPSNPS